MLQHKLSKIAFLLLMTVSQVALAAPFSITWTSVLGTNTTAPYNIGEAVIITFVVDNGGTSIVSQTWNAVDVVSVTYTFNDAPNTITTIFDPNGGDGLSGTSGSFQTDAGGSLTASPTDWNDTSATGTVVFSNDPIGITDFRWWVNGSNEVLVNDTGGVLSAQAFADPVVTNIDPVYWSFTGETRLEAEPIPTMSNWALILFSLLIAFVGLTRVRRQF